MLTFSNKYKSHCVTFFIRHHELVSLFISCLLEHRLYKIVIYNHSTRNVYGIFQHGSPTGRLHIKTFFFFILDDCSKTFIC